MPVALAASFKTTKARCSMPTSGNELRRKAVSVCSGSVPFPLTGLNHPRAQDHHVFSLGFQNSLKLFSRCKLDRFPQRPVRFAKKPMFGERGAYFLHENSICAFARIEDWLIVAMSDADPARSLSFRSCCADRALAAIDRGRHQTSTQELERIVRQRRRTSKGRLGSPCDAESGGKYS